MSTAPKIILSAFADEGANSKSVVEQLAVIAALGLKYYSPRFLDLEGSGNIQHVVDLGTEGWKKLAEKHAEYGVNVASIGARVGKIKLTDFEDDSHNVFVPFDEYMEGEVQKTIDAALALGTKLIRGFSFYHPKGESPDGYIEEAAVKIKKIVDQCAASGLIYGLEVEANLIGQNGRTLAALGKAVDSPNMVLIFDGGNLSCQNLTPVDCFDEYEAMKEYIGWSHIKDYRVDRSLEWTGVVDEERLKNFVPADIGDTGHERIMRDLKSILPDLTAHMQSLGVPGVFLELEPHLKGGGQFGGFSGPDGLGVAVRSLCNLLDYTGIHYDLRTMDDITADRGF